MRVLFICPFVPWPLVNGGKIRTFNLVKNAARDAEIHLRVIREPGMAEDAEEALAPHCASLQFFERSRPGSWMRWSRPKLERWFHSPGLQAAVRQEMQTGGHQLVHLDELLLARLPAGAHTVPVVQHHHKLDTVLYDTLNAARGPHRYFDLWKLRRLEAESARRYRHHLTCSEGDAAILRERHGALDCAAVPSGFDPAFHRPADPPATREPGRLLFLGSMDYGPNVDAVDTFVRLCLPRIRERFPEAVLDVVGGNPTAEVRALAGDGVHVTGRVDDVRPWLERAAAMVVPLRIGGGTRLKIVEALAMRTPVVSTNIGAEGLGLEDGVHALLADDAEGMIEHVCSLLADPDRSHALAYAGEDFVHERYTWDVLARELVDYWERIAFSGSVSPSR